MRSRWLKYVVAFIWFVLMDRLRDAYDLSNLLVFVIVGAGLALIFYLFEQMDKRPN
ncbi:hypothetical protein [Paenibacillus montanisoli]|uniref:hypothetical protein n=1 Tax=Paenibacillus montanisoli TaxID=2081970 RepID=UPI0014032B48|nr:hypothetical protein [Paenibacillus montanisoli]